MSWRLAYGAVSVPPALSCRSMDCYANWPTGRLLAPAGGSQPAKVLDETLRAIAARHGARTADFVAMQLEYPGSGASR
ncbi:hypothetical protein ACSGFO_15105 [Mesorhizobium sp. WSM4083]|uniref:hypothetical protein n=1 Tax=Mesorhizobium sp. WSM4083 TaxID=3446363 RepID=UPI0004AEFCE6